MHPSRGATIWTRSSEAASDELDLQITASNSFDSRNPATRILTLATAVTVPASVGSIRLTSSDPRVAPRIDYGLLAEPRDRRRLLQGVKMAHSIGRIPPLAGFIDHEISPGRDIVSDDALGMAIEAKLDTYHHGCSTAPMGGEETLLLLSIPSAVFAVYRDCVSSMRRSFPRFHPRQPISRQSCWRNALLRRSSRDIRLARKICERVRSASALGSRNNCPMPALSRLYLPCSGRSPRRFDSLTASFRS